MDVSTFVTKMSEGGSRTNRFKIVTSKISGNVEYYCKATSLPASNVGKCEANYMGRIVNFAGDRVFDDWNVTIYNEVGHTEREAIITWMEDMNAHEGNYGGMGINTYYEDECVVYQLKRDGTEDTVAYKFSGLFPISCGEVSLGWDQNDQVEEFEVTFALNYWDDA